MPRRAAEVLSRSSKRDADPRERESNVCASNSDVEIHPACVRRALFADVVQVFREQTSLSPGPRLCTPDVNILDSSYPANSSFLLRSKLPAEYVSRK